MIGLITPRATSKVAARALGALVTTMVAAGRTSTMEAMRKANIRQAQRREQKKKKQKQKKGRKAWRKRRECRGAS